MTDNALSRPFTRAGEFIRITWSVNPPGEARCNFRCSYDKSMYKAHERLARTYLSPPIQFRDIYLTVHVWLFHDLRHSPPRCINISDRCMKERPPGCVKDLTPLIERSLSSFRPSRPLLIIMDMGNSLPLNILCPYIRLMPTCSHYFLASTGR